MDDNADSRKLLLKILASFGFDVKEAVNGEDALARWRAWRPDLIWMDMRMPMVDGYKAVKEIRKLTRNWKPKTGDKKPETVIIAQSAISFDEDRRSALDAGCDDFLPKPFRDADVFELMRRRLGVLFIYEESETGRQADGAANAGGSHALLSDVPDDLLQRL